ncbi:metal-iron-binding protein [Clostridium autoethanogenum]|uniref:Metal-iron-binding protein n=1 Tax=Clostridium autoethanogenum TaxID=84023 RepID=A0A3M0S1U8_9CLOT|nr:ferritin family protein [Clostridium autoethanogenum]RMC91921.1 metal-iron-binding protein [Clostridium autoethanogenum]
MNKLICSICGMVIDDKNYFFNKEAFLGQNTSENVMFCPFCGAPAAYLIESEDKINIPKYNLDDSYLKIVDNAFKLEIFNGDFYKEASKLAKDPKIKNMFRALSKIEYMHASVHKKIGGFISEPKLKKLDYSKYESDDKLIEMACKREKHAVRYYEKYTSHMKNNKVKEIFNVLAGVEKIHIQLTRGPI